MNRRVRLRIEMGARAASFSLAQPDTEPAMQAAAAKLAQLADRFRFKPDAETSAVHGKPRAEAEPPASIDGAVPAAGPGH